jgi:hypothetical protein
MTQFRLGIEAMRLGIAYEYDPYFSLPIARVDPLPHLEKAAVIGWNYYRRGYPKKGPRGISRA